MKDTDPAAIDLRIDVEKALRRIRPENRALVIAYLGLDGEGRHSQTDLAKIRGCSVTRIGQRLRRALCDLRAPLRRYA